MNNDYYEDESSEESAYIGNLDTTTTTSPEHKSPKNLWQLEILVNHLQRRVSLLERALGPAHIVKATPAVALLYMDMNCKKRVKVIYENWIRFMGYISRQKNGLNIEIVFWALDKFVFDNYFSQKKVFIIPVEFNVTYSNEDFEKISKCISQDRDFNHNLKNPSDKEFISTMVSPSNPNEIYLMYYPLEITKQMDPTTPAKREVLFQDVQLKTGDPLPLNKSVVSELDSSSIGIQSGISPNLQVVGNLDKRLVVLGSQRAMYNSVVDTYQIDRCQENLHSMGEPALRLSLMTFHAMLHLKTASEYNTHSNEFLKEFINYTPSVLFGHEMFPLMTIAD